MNILVFATYEKLSQRAAEEMVSAIKAKPNAVLCIASGHSPLKACEIFVRIIQENNIDVSQARFVGLDEWLGVNPNDSGSGESFFRNNIAKPLRLAEDKFHMFSAAATDLNSECANMDEVIRKVGGIDLMVVGIGINGHIGFNEPGVSFELRSHVIQLAETTTEVGQKYFSAKQPLKNGITLGLTHLMEARKVLLLANGAKKTEIVAKALTGSVSSEVPASIVQSHPNILVLLDEDAASGLNSSFERVA